MSFIQAHGLAKRYGQGETAVWAVKDLYLRMERGEFVAFMGESGSGKSSLLSLMGGLNTPTHGSYHVDGIDVYSLKPNERADFRRQSLGIVFQSFHLIPYLTVIENILLPLAASPLRSTKKRTKAGEALERVGLRGKNRRLPSQISGGEQERVAIARAIVNDPPILLADEPTGNLDSKTGREIMNLFQELNASGVTIAMVTHNPEAAGYARRTFRMTDGLLAEESESIAVVDKHYCELIGNPATAAG